LHKSTGSKWQKIASYSPYRTASRLFFGKFKKRNTGSPYPSSVEAPLSIGDTATATAEALWRLFPLSMGQQ
jgi:hypothetical protein